MIDRRLIATAATCFVVGVAAGYKYGTLRFEKRFMRELDALVAAEVETATTLYRKKKEGLANQEYGSPEEAAAELVPNPVKEALSAYRGETREQVAYHTIRKSAVEVAAEEEADKPDPIQEEGLYSIEETVGVIRVISIDEFTQNDPGYDEVTLTYYEEDEVLADIADEQMDDVDGVIGLDSLKQFGGVSGDENMLYVRNDKLRLFFEVTRSSGAYCREVHGLEPVTGPRPSQSGG